MKVKENNDLCLIITGCISPVQQKFLVLTDVSERLRQYLKSIEYYIESSNFKNIVFCDNSNYEYNSVSYLYKLANKNEKNFEWISFMGDVNKEISKGKGYGEGEIIDYALNNSKLVSCCHYFAKVTGRLIIRNINDLLSKSKYDARSVFMNIDIYRRKGIDTRFYITNKATYQLLYSEAYKKVNVAPPVAIEDLFYAISLKHKQSWNNLPVYPRFEGKSGGNGRDYSNESNNRLKVFDFLCKHNFFNKCNLLLYINTRWIERKINWNYVVKK